MKIKPVVWTKSKQQYLNSIDAKIEHIKIGSVHWDALKSKDDKGGNYKANFNLPGYKQPMENFETEEAGKKWVEEIFKIWLNKISLTQ